MPPPPLHRCAVGARRHPDGSGALVWRAATGGQVRSSATPSADGTLVFVGSSDGFLYAFDAKSGETAWRSFCGDSDPEYGVRSTPALSRDQRHVYVGSADGFAYCFESGAEFPVIVTES